MMGGAEAVRAVATRKASSSVVAGVDIQVSQGLASLSWQECSTALA